MTFYAVWFAFGFCCFGLGAGIDRVITSRDKTRLLPLVPEPVLTPAERAALAAVYRDPAFWEWFATQPEPPD